MRETNTILGFDRFTAWLSSPVGKEITRIHYLVEIMRHIFRTMRLKINMISILLSEEFLPSVYVVLNGANVAPNATVAKAVNANSMRFSQQIPTASPDFILNRSCMHLARCIVRWRISLAVNSRSVMPSILNSRMKMYNLKEIFMYLFSSYYIIQHSQITQNRRRFRVSWKATRQKTWHRRKCHVHCPHIRHIEYFGYICCSASRKKSSQNVPYWFGVTRLTEINSFFCVCLSTWCMISSRRHSHKHTHLW